MNFFRRIYSFDYMGHKYWWFTISGIIIAAGLISLFVKGGGNPVNGLNYGLEFSEGTRISTVLRAVADARGGAPGRLPGRLSPTRRSSRPPTSPTPASPASRSRPGC